jgi:hypothetical protein
MWGQTWANFDRGNPLENNSNYFGGTENRVRGPRLPYPEYIWFYGSNFKKLGNTHLNTGLKGHHWRESRDSIRCRIIFDKTPTRSE